MTLYQIDAFAESAFTGNPAAVVLLSEWPSDRLMQQIAMENNLSETAFLVKKSEQLYALRWFTPSTEVDLCGHATLASAWVLFHEEKIPATSLQFETRSGLLTVQKEGDALVMDFPADTLHPHTTDVPELLYGLGVQAREVYKGGSDWLVVLDSQAEVQHIIPDLKTLKKIPARGIIVTAKGEDCDFVSRFFGPNCGVDEDPVTGSAHTTLSVYWAKVLKKNTFTARQLSKRGGIVYCTLAGDRVLLKGKARLFLKGEIYL